MGAVFEKRDDPDGGVIVEKGGCDDGTVGCRGQGILV